MEFINICYKEGNLTRAQAVKFVLILNPFAPHVAEELWNKLGHQTTLSYEPWPAFEEGLTLEDSVVISIQVNGKFRGTVTVETHTSETEIIAAATDIDSVKKHLEGKILKKKIYVPGKILNFVV